MSRKSRWSGGGLTALSPGNDWQTSAQGCHPVHDEVSSDVLRAEPDQSANSSEAEITAVAKPVHRSLAASYVRGNSSLVVARGIHGRHRKRWGVYICHIDSVKETSATVVDYIAEQ